MHTCMRNEYISSYILLGDSSESESRDDCSTDGVLSSSHRSRGDYDSDDHNLVAQFSSSPIPSDGDCHDLALSDHDSYSASVLSEYLNDDACYGVLPDDTSDADSTVPESDSFESEDYNCNDLPADYAFMAESFKEGSSVTVGRAVLSVMEFCINNHLATDDLLKLLQVLCITPNKLPKSVYLLKNFFRNYKRTEYSHDKVCSNCSQDSSHCTCNDPRHGDLIAISITKPLEAIVVSIC